MKNVVEYILATKIKAAILQAILESKDELDFSSLEELAFAMSADAVRFLENQKLIVIKDSSVK